MAFLARYGIPSTQKEQHIQHGRFIKVGMHDDDFDDFDDFKDQDLDSWCILSVRAFTDLYPGDRRTIRLEPMA
jgi:hypothetical protein